ncbi:MAG: hypothetical protein ABIQ88_02455 [Chitinophagaceae bacterium]
MNTPDNITAVNIKSCLFTWLLCFSLLLGSSYNTYLAYERFYNPDTETYINIARFNFKDQSLIRRYRILVPAAAALVAKPIAPFYNKLFQDKRTGADWPLATGFLLVNCVLMATAGLFIYLICVHYNISQLGTLLGLMAFTVGGRWQSFIAGHPCTDSLCILVTAMLVYALLKQQTWLLLLAILIGPFSKESFIFFVPLMIWFARGTLRWKAMAALLAAYSIHIAFRHWVDAQDMANMQASLHADMAHFDNIIVSLQKFVSVKGWGEMFTMYGLFTFIYVAALFYKSIRAAIIKNLTLFNLLFIGIMLVHAILSSEISRMFFIGSALFIPWMAKLFDLLKEKMESNAPPAI